MAHGRFCPWRYGGRITQFASTRPQALSYLLSALLLLGGCTGTLTGGPEQGAPELLRAAIRPGVGAYER